MPHQHHLSRTDQRWCRNTEKQVKLTANFGLGHGLLLQNQRRCRWLECEDPSWIEQIQEVHRCQNSPKTRGQSQRFSEFSYDPPRSWPAGGTSIPWVSSANMHQSGYPEPAHGTFDTSNLSLEQRVRLLEENMQRVANNLQYLKDGLWEIRLLLLRNSKITEESSDEVDHKIFFGDENRPGFDGNVGRFFLVGHMIRKVIAA